MVLVIKLIENNKRTKYFSYCLRKYGSGPNVFCMFRRLYHDVPIIYDVDTLYHCQCKDCLEYREKTKVFMQITGIEYYDEW